jgi:hypothetical protein
MRTISAILNENAAKWPDREALIATHRERDTQLTFAALEKQPNISQPVSFWKEFALATRCWSSFQCLLSCMWPCWDSFGWEPSLFSSILRHGLGTSTRVVRGFLLRLLSACGRCDASPVRFRSS